MAFENAAAHLTAEDLRVYSTPGDVVEIEPTEERIACALERIATALEAQVADQHDQAAFSRMLLKGISPEEAGGVGFEDYRLVPGRMEFGNDDSWEVKANGQWRPATLAEEQEIADMNQKRRRR